MAYGMQTYNASGGLEFDSSSYGGIPIDMLDLSTTATSNTPVVIRYPAYTGRTLTVIPLISGDYLYKVYGPYEGVPPTSDANGGFPQITYWSVNPDFSPTLATHGFEKKPTRILVLIK
jgi:hypothetical protein